MALFRLCERNAKPDTLAPQSQAATGSRVGSDNSAGPHRWSAERVEDILSQFRPGRQLYVDYEDHEFDDQDDYNDRGHGLLTDDLEDDYDDYSAARCEYDFRTSDFD